MQRVGLKVWPLLPCPFHVCNAMELFQDLSICCMQELLAQSSPSGSSCTTHGQQTSPSTGEGDLLALINALQTTPARQTLHTAAAVKNLLQHGIGAFRDNISFHGPAAFCGHSSCGASSSVQHVPHLSQDPRLHLSSAAAPTFPPGGGGACPPPPLRQFLDGLFDPKRTGAELAVLAESATERLRSCIMAATNGRVVLPGGKVSKQAQGKLAIKDADIEAMFAELDVNQNGYIDKVEFLKAFDRMGLPANTEYLR